MPEYKVNKYEVSITEGKEVIVVTVSQIGDNFTAEDAVKLTQSQNPKATVKLVEKK